MTDNITVAMVFAARDLVQQVIGPDRLTNSPEQDAETLARAFKTIYRAVAESVFHGGSAPKR